MIRKYKIHYRNKNSNNFNNSKRGQTYTSDNFQNNYLDIQLNSRIQLSTCSGSQTLQPIPLPHGMHMHSHPPTLYIYFTFLVSVDTRFPYMNYKTEKFVQNYIYRQFILWALVKWWQRNQVSKLSVCFFHK